MAFTHGLFDMKKITRPGNHWRRLHLLLGLFSSLLFVSAEKPPVEWVIFKDIFIRPETIGVEDRVEIKLIVENASSKDLPLTGKLVIDGKEITSSASLIPSGGEGDILFYITFHKPKAYELTVIVSPEGSDEYQRLWQRLWSGAVVVKGKQIKGVELSIDGSLSIYPPFPTPNENVEIGVTIENIGSEPAQDVPVYFYQNDHAFDRVTIDINAMDSEFVSVPWSAPAGEYHIRAVIDPQGTIGENKDNDSVTRWVIVR